MYWLRGVVISLAVFFVVYAALAGILACAWRKLGLKQAIRSAAMLYGMRMLPLLGATVMVTLFAVPSYLYLEPRWMNERTGSAAWVLAGAGAVLLFTALIRSGVAWRNSSRFVSACLRGSQALAMPSGIRAYEVEDKNPAVFVMGVWRPRVVISSGAVALLEPEEIRAGVQHEIAHVRRGDNLKKLLLHFCPLPWLASLEQEWLKAVEMAADDAAASDEKTAAELASALLKMTRAASPAKAPALGMALLPANGALVSARVRRLLGGSRAIHAQSHAVWWVALAAAALAASANYAWLLMKAHVLTEILIR